MSKGETKIDARAVYEYKTRMVDGWPDAILSAEAVAGWELVAVTPGGFDRDDKAHASPVTTLWLRRERMIDGPG